MLSNGLLFTFFTGMMWTGVGICFSIIAKRNINFVSFILIYSLVISIASWVIFPDYSNISSVSSSDWITLCGTMLPYGLLGTLGFWAVRTAMLTGRHGIVWSLAQSAVILPFAFGVIVFGEEYSMTAWIGFFTLIISIIILSIIHNDKANAYGHSWIAMALLAFLLIGISQIFSMLPNRFDISPTAQTLRIPLMVLAGLAWIILATYHRTPINKETLIFSTIYASLVIIGQFGVFRALDAMSGTENTALVYPLAIGVSIVLFFLYSILLLKEKSTILAISAITMLVLGIILMAL